MVIALIASDRLSRSAIQDAVKGPDIVSKPAEEHLGEQREPLANGLIKRGVVAFELLSFPRGMSVGRRRAPAPTDAARSM